MSESTFSGPIPEPEQDDEPLGLTLSELLGEVWSPVGRSNAPHDDTAVMPLVTDPDPGDRS